jgi:hypothetical protein
VKLDFHGKPFDERLNRGSDGLAVNLKAFDFPFNSHRKSAGVFIHVLIDVDDVPFVFVKEG